MVGTQLADSTRCSPQMLNQAALRRWLGANSIAFRAVRTGKANSTAPSKTTGANGTIKTGGRAITTASF